nr:hypothetical protein HAGR004_16330 [Bdellovibrio sp. HAGR004]
MKNNSINLGFNAEQWQSHMRTAFEFSGKAKTELSAFLKSDIANAIHSIFSSDSSVVKNLKSVGRES